MNQTIRTAARRAGILGTLTAAVGTAATLLPVVSALAATQPLATVAAARMESQSVGWAFLSAALSTGLAALGAGYAVARVGSSAVGALAEKPELFGRVLVLVGLAEGIAIYGLIVSILVLNRLA